MSGEAPFSELLRQQRRAAGYSQEDLAERAGLSLGAVGSLEQGLRRAPRRDTVKALADALDMSDSARRLFEEAAARTRGRQSHENANLPVTLTSFIERNEVNELRALLGDHRLLTITGSGGVGKTRIAIEVARRIEQLYDEIWFVDLLPVRDGSFVTAQISARVGVSSDGDDALNGIVRHLRKRRAFLIIDNCEHVVDNVASVVTELLHRCPTVTVLATSREALALSGEVAYRLPPLDVRAGCELFATRAKAADPALSLDRQRLAVVEDICRGLDGIPLAIELAASRVSTFGFERLRNHIRNGMTLTGNRDLPLRHQTMVATIAWSYDLLSDAERTLFQRLSVFAASFALEAAEEVCSQEPLTAGGVGDHLARLVQKCLVDVEHVGDTTRYRLLDSIRAFAMERLSSSGELDAIMSSLIERLKRRASAIDSSPSLRLLLEHRVDLDDVRACVRWAVSTGHRATVIAAAQLTIGFRGVWHVQRRVSELRALAFPLLENLSDDRDPEIVGRLLHVIAPGLTGSEYLALASRATPLLERTGHNTRAAYLHARSAEAEYQLGNRAAAERHAASAASLMESFRGTGSHESVAIASTSVYVFMLLRDFAAARAVLESLKISASDPFEIESALMMAEVEFEDGNVEKALELTKRCRFNLSRYPNSDYLTIDVFGYLAKYLLATGDTHAAETALRESLTYALDTGDFRVNYVHVELARYAAAIAAITGRAQLAARLLGASDAEDQRSLILPKDVLAMELTASAIGAQLAGESLEELSAKGAGEELQDLFEEFLAQPAAADNARASATSSPLATSVTRSSPN